MKSKIFIILGLLLLITSTIFITRDKIIEYKAEKAANEVLYAINNNDYEIKENKEKMDTVTIDGYDYIGSISIPAINIDLPVLDTWDYTRLNIGPCLYYGQLHEKNMIICGHSYKKHFKYLSNLKQGDYVIFTDVSEEKYIYEVEEILVLSSTDIDEMINNNFDLTLYTCTNDGLNRLTVRCNLIDI